ncbi:MAG: OmpA family protein [Candidatus Kapabacteria bacterium]|nr:OmpA family protein [Candidatus Kapabacteria bacterium]
MYVLMLAIAVAFLGIGCRDIVLQSGPAVRLVECPPPPEPPCTSSRWQGEELDTATQPPYRDQQYWWHIRPVRGAATAAQEYAVALVEGNTALLTRGSLSQQVLITARFVHPDSLACSPDSILPERTRSIGTVTTNGQILLASYMPTGSRLVHVGRLMGTVFPPQRIRLEPLIHEQGSWIAHPALSPDGSFLVVTADRPGGYGGLDLWYSRRRADGSWDTLRNLGPLVNTPCDELSPSICRDGTLLFASNGHATVGGYDLFAARLDMQGGTIRARDVENLRPPINTAADELFPYSPSTPRELLYWSSNRREENFDLYVAERRERPKAPPPPVVAEEPEELETPWARLRGQVRTQDRRPIDNADVSVRDVERKRTVAQTRTDSTGTFETLVPTERNLEVIAQSERGFYDVQRIRIPRTDTVFTLAQELTIPDVLTLRINFPHDQARIPYEFVLDSNGMQTDRRWTEELDRVAANIKQYQHQIKRVVLVGHTDPNGTDAYNLQLGQRRVEFVIEELVKRGVPPALLEGISAGERNLLPRRPGEPVEVYYRRNRRVELSKVLQ